ncbi:MAG: hypothetical protein Q4G45_06110, partial [Actinomycetia bacterium]|nr:hypothetical protein [Actinomycetes bacterium]
MTLHYDLDAIRSHANGVSGQSTTMSKTSTTMSATGPGPKEMYGILVSQIAHPILNHVSDGGENMLQGLAEFLDSLEESLAQAVA